jgi:hypothetical protein
VNEKNRGRCYLLSLVLLAGGMAAGWIFRGRLDALFAPAMANLTATAEAFSPGSGFRLGLLFFILAKNFLVVFLALAAAPLVNCAARLQDMLAARFPPLNTPHLLSARLGRRFAPGVPALVLVVNGAMLAWSAALFRSEGIPWPALAGGLLPHGVPELGALCLACGYALAAPAVMRERLLFAARVVLPLFAVAATVEVFVSPAVMERFL